MLNRVYTCGLALVLFLSFAFLTACGGGGGGGGGGLPARLAIVAPDSEVEEPLTVSDRVTVRYLNEPDTQAVNTLSIRLNGVEVAGLFSEPDADDEYKMHASVFALAGAMKIDGSDNTLEAKVLGSRTERRSFTYDGGPEVVLTKVANETSNPGYQGTFSWIDQDGNPQTSDRTSLSPPLNNQLPALANVTELEGIVRNAVVDGLKITTGPSSSPVTDDVTVTDGTFADQFNLSDTNEDGLADIRFSDAQDNPLQDIAWPKREMARALALQLSEEVFAEGSPLPQWTADTIMAFVQGVENDPLELDGLLDAAQQEQLCLLINALREQEPGTPTGEIDPVAPVSNCSGKIVSVGITDVEPEIVFSPSMDSWQWQSKVTLQGLRPILSITTADVPDTALEVELPFSNNTSMDFEILLSSTEPSARLLKFELPSEAVSVAFEIDTIREATCQATLCDGSRFDDGELSLGVREVFRSEMKEALSPALFEQAIGDAFDDLSLAVDSTRFFELVSLRKPVCDKDAGEDCVISSLITHLVSAQYSADTAYSAVSIRGSNYVEDQGVHLNAAGSSFVEYDATAPIDMGDVDSVSMAVSSNWINQLLLSVYQSNLLSTVRPSVALGDLGDLDLSNLDQTIQPILDFNNLSNLTLDIAEDHRLTATIDISSVPYIRFLRDAENGSWFEIHLNELELGLLLPDSEFQPWLNAGVVSNLDSERCGTGVDGCLYIDTTMDVKARFRFGLDEDSLPVVDFASDDIMVRVTRSDGSKINNLLADIPQSILHNELQSQPELVEPVWSLVGEQKWLDQNHLQSLLPVLVGGFLQQQIQEGLLQLEPRTLAVGCDSGADPDTLIERFLGEGRAIELVVQGLEVEDVEKPHYLFIKAAARDKAESAGAIDKAFFELNLVVGNELCETGS